MPTNTTSPQTIARVYAAFDAGSHRIFRVAMNHSRGGSVRVDDLLAALLECEPEVVRLLWPENLHRYATRLPTPITEDRRLLPMSNEPALRTLLFTALQHAEANLDQQQRQITPAVLAAAAARQHSVGRQPRSLRCVSAPIPDQPAIAPEAHRAVVEELLNGWCDLQLADHAEAVRSSEAKILRLLTSL